MGKFEEPMVEFIALDNTQVVYTSNTAGNVLTCKGGNMADFEWCMNPMLASAGACDVDAKIQYPCADNAHDDI